MYIAFTDGGSRAGYEAACASHIRGIDADMVVGRYLGTKTNNEAEWSGLILALELAEIVKCSRLQVYSDSMLVVNQMRGTWKVSKEELFAYKHRAQALAERLKEFKIDWVPREQNSIADAAVNVVLDRREEEQIWNPLQKH